MKILYYSPHPTLNSSAPSGPGTHIREVILAFEKQGHQVVRIIRGGEKEVEIDTSSSQKKKIVKSILPNFVWQTLKDIQLLRFDRANKQLLESIIKAEKPDLIYERAYYLMHSGHVLAKKFGVRYFCEINAPYPEEKVSMEGRSFLLPLARFREKTQIQKADRIFTVSSVLKEYLIKKSSASLSKIIVTPNAINPTHLSLSDQKTDEIRVKYGILPEDRVIGFVGSIFPYHGVDVLIQAFEKWLNSGNTGYKLLIVGDGEILPQLRKYCENGLLKKTVVFTGNIPHSDIYHYIALFDIAVMAKSNWYGSPVKIFEYGAMGKVVIAPNVAPVLDVMVNNVDGLLVNDSPIELVKAIKQIETYRDKADKMSVSFQNKVLNCHTWDTVVSTILSEVK